MDKTWYFDHATQKFTEGPNLLQKRSGPAAGVLIDSVTKEKLILVVGGSKGPTEYLGSTEILKGENWELGMY